VAQRLAELGIAPGDRVASVLPNGPDAAAALLTISSHATLVPLNPDLTRGEYESYLLELSPAVMLVPAGVDHAARIACRSLRIPVLEIVSREEAGWFSIEGRTGLAPAFVRGVTTEDLAYIISTSGTTNGPRTGSVKFVPVPHRVACTGAAAVIRMVALSPEDRCLNFNPLFHSLGIVSGILAPIASGGSVACVPGFQLARLPQHLRDFDPTWFSAVPTVLQTLAENAQDLDDAFVRSRVRAIRSAGAALTPEIAERLHELLEVRVLEVYGMSEAPCIAADFFSGPARKPGSVGRPMYEGIRVIGDDGFPLPDGHAGQIVVGGPWVISGYFNNEAATAAAFSNGWFQTGDIGYFDADGDLFLTGRSKEAINRGGEKISPLEVDAALLMHPAVAEAAAFSIPDPKLGEEIAAAVVLRPQAALTAAALQDFAATHIAVHKVPRTIVFLDRLPKGATGKLNRFRLARELGLDAPATCEFRGTAAVQPRGERERVIASIFARALGAADVGLHDNFFDLGGDSLTAMRCLAEIKATFGLAHISPALFLWAPTVGAIADNLREPDRFAEWPNVLPLQPIGEGLPLFIIDPGFEFRDVIRHLGEEHPVFGIRPPSLEHAKPPHTVERVAAGCVRTLRQFRPQGPYALAGWCASGVVALEMARQLEDEGEQVTFVALLDAREMFLPPMPRWRRSMVRAVRSAARVAFLAARPAGELAARIRSACRRRWHRLVQARDPFGEALRQHRPQPWSGRMIHLWARERPRGPFRDLEFEWRHLSPRGFRFHEIPGDHVTMLYGSNAEAVADVLAAELSRASEFIASEYMSKKQELDSRRVAYL
jgi:acyl-CoA synthetase (AMP-forming)/AMP-acid ligase II/thioesterase domain-containing protein